MEMKINGKGYIIRVEGNPNYIDYDYNIEVRLFDKEIKIGGLKKEEMKELINDMRLNRVNVKIEIEKEKEILDNKEKEYLRGVIKPFKDRVTCIIKGTGVEEHTEYIRIKVKNDVSIMLPEFKRGKMYKGMKLEKEYTLKELGL